LSGFIDLGQYLRVLLRWSPLIVLLTLLGALAGLLLSLARPAAYQSSATLLVKPAPQNVNVSSQNANTARIDPVTASLLVPDISVRSLASMANSTEVEKPVQRRLGNQLPEQLRKPGALLGQVNVSDVAGRPGLMEVVATARTQALATDLANTWASSTAEYLNSQLTPVSFDPGAAEQELNQRLRELGQSEEALARYEETSPLVPVASQLAASTSLLQDYDRQSNQIQLDLEKADLLRAQLRGGTANQASALALQLLTLSSYTSQATNVDASQFLPQVEDRLNAQGQTLDVAPTQLQQGTSLQVQPVLNELAALPAAQQASFVSSLSAALRAKQADLQRTSATLQKRISTLRGQLSRAAARRDRLATDVSVNRTTYESLGTAIGQQGVLSRIQSSKVSLADPAIDAQRTGLRGFLAPLLGGVLGALLGTLLAFLMEFARRSRGASSPQVRRAVEIPAQDYMVSKRREQ
jgi:capsular polysaccharide biosynthesis protein